jgi:hypothetical protein
MRSKILGIFKKKVYDQQFLSKLKLKVKMTFRLFVEDLKWKNCQKQFKVKIIIFSLII